MTQVVRCTPESDRSDRELRALLRAFGVCPRCSTMVLKLRRQGTSRGTVRFPVCSETCANGVRGRSDRTAASAGAR
jgi:hypothetical protein